MTVVTYSFFQEATTCISETPYPIYYPRLLDPDYFYFNFWVGWDWFFLVRRPLFDRIYQMMMMRDDECEAVAGIRIGKESRRNAGKPAPVPICPQYE
jgi:hypothetical protein